MMKFNRYICKALTWIVKIQAHQYREQMHALTCGNCSGIFVGRQTTVSRLFRKLRCDLDYIKRNVEKTSSQDRGTGRHTVPPHTTKGGQQFKNKKQPELTEN